MDDSAQQGFGQLLGALIQERREAAHMTQVELAAESFPDGKDIDGKARRIRELEAGEITRPQAKNYGPICETLNIDRATIRALKQQSKDAKAQAEAEFTEAFPDSAQVGSAIADPGALSRDELELLAGRFEITGVADRTDADLRKLLTLKAEEYRALKSEVDGISEGLRSLHNLKLAAQDAIARVDLEEVEALLSRVQEVEKEEAAKTAELRADNALLRGNVEQAAALLEDAADSFRIIDPMEPARRAIIDYNVKLKVNARRFGGTGYRHAIKLIEARVHDRLRSEDANLWAAGKNTLAISCQELGARTEGASGADLLAHAVTACRAALEVHTRADYPLDWAGTQNNLGNALRDQGTRTEGAAGADLLAQAVTAYRAALAVFTRADHPKAWAAAQNNLGAALMDQGNRTKGTAGADLLAEAVTAYRAALAVRTLADYLVDWAGTQNNLGNALLSQGTRTEGAAGTDLLAQAITAYRASLKVTTRADYPVDWAETQANVAIALKIRAARPEATDPAGDLRAALEAVEGTLEVYDPIHMSYKYVTAIRLRDRIQAALDAL